MLLIKPKSVYFDIWMKTATVPDPAWVFQNFYVVRDTMELPVLSRHSREGGNPGFVKPSWTPAFGGVRDLDIKKDVLWCLECGRQPSCLVGDVVRRDVTGLCAVDQT